jgi:hypothetical protein
MEQPQFIQSSVESRKVDIDRTALVTFFLAPVVGAFIFFFWLALDNPPLPVIPLTICIACAVLTVAAGTAIARSRGVPLVGAILIGLVALPCLLITASFVLIALAFMLGGIF